MTSRPRLSLEVTGAVIVVLIALAALAVSLTRSTRTASPSSSQPSTRYRLLHSLDLIDNLVTPNGYPFAVSLVTALQTADPGTRYQALGSPVQAPAPNTMGIYDTPHSVWVSVLTGAGSITQVRHVTSGPGAGTYGPMSVSSSAVPDGDFSTPLTDIWTITTGPIARVMRDTRVYATPPGSLRVLGTGAGGRTASVVAQVVTSPLPAAAGTTYQLGLLARTLALTRPLSVELKLVYTDNSADFFTATSRTSPTVAGIPPGSSVGWVPLGARAVARKRVKQVVLFAVDTGLARFTGSAWIDDIGLSAS